MEKIFYRDGKEPPTIVEKEVVRWVERDRLRLEQRLFQPVGRRLGRAIREAETTGAPWTVDETKPNAKHAPKSKRSTIVARSAAAALRLLLFTGCRLREILSLRWEDTSIWSAALSVPSGQQERAQDRHPQRPCPCGVECAGAARPLRGAWRRTGTTPPRFEAPLGCGHETGRPDWRATT